MATLLHRIGRWSTHHRWTVILTWLLVAALAGTGAALFSKPLTSEISVPGSRFQQVLDDLEREIPESSGVMGTVAFSSEEPFTEDQRRAVADLTRAWSDLDGVIEATDPFTVQNEMDAGEDQLAQGREELQAARGELEAGRAELDAAQRQLDLQAAQLAAGRSGMPPQQVAAMEQQIAAGQAEIDAARAELEQGQQELAAGEVQLEQAARMAALTDGVRQVSEDGTAAMTQIRFDAVSTVDPDVADEVQRLGSQLEDTGVQVDYSTEIVSDLSSVVGPAEAVGLAIAALVLLVMLGSLVAAGLPLLIALVGVGIGIGGAMALSAVVEMNSTTPALALMLGLAVGIDYSLFILNRHRIQLADGMPLRRSIALATGTSGTAVTFAGTTVIIALSALAVTGFGFLTVMGLVAATTVALAVLASLTLTPALLSLLGERVLSSRQRRRGRHLDDDPPRRSWAAMVQRRPWWAVLGVVLVAGLLASPTPQLRLGLPDGSAEPADSTAYRTYDLIRDNFGAGANGPLIAVASAPRPLGEEAAGEVQFDLAERLAEVDGVDYVVPFGVSEDRDTLAFQLAPDDGPSAEPTVALVNELDRLTPDIEATFDVRLGLTGQTVANIDLSEQLSDALPLYLLLVVGLSLLLLLLVFRSVWVPLLATAGFLLSLAAAFGGVVATYQLGIASGLFGVHEPGPILSFLPILLIGVLFGLAMDYQVFLVSAMREAHVHGDDARAAVVDGFNHSARVVTAAAIIMISVFGGFVFAHLTMIRPIGFGLALGVLVDAFLVRMTLTPAVLSLLGEKAWWLPQWLDRLLPDVDVEGATLERSLAVEHTHTAQVPVRAGAGRT